MLFYLCYNYHIYLNQIVQAQTHGYILLFLLYIFFFAEVGINKLFFPLFQKKSNYANLAWDCKITQIL